MKKLIALAGVMFVASGILVVAQETNRTLSGRQVSQSAPSTAKGQKAKKPSAKSQDDEEKEPSGASKLSKEQIIKVQKILKRFDYYEGPLDGKLNPDLQQAIKDFQEDESLDKTGQLDEETLKRILALQDEESGEESPSEKPPSY
jgi:peptidoglycan hydrolase-like protein with peptidoglycan-binding domain